jgi:hypothetical protein
MADSFDKFNDMFGKNKADLDAIRQGTKEVEKSLGGWAKASYDIHQTQKDINHINGELAKAQQEILKWNKENGKELDKLQSKTKKLTTKDKERLKVLLLQKAARDGQVESIEKEVKQLEKSLKLQKESVKEANKLKSIARSTGNFVKKWGWDKLKSYGVFEMDKAIRSASRSMALGNNQFESFSKNLSTAADSTVMMGVNVSQLAKMQEGYSKEIGRSVRLTEDGLKAMAGLAQGTGLGEQFAIGMVSAMDNFGVGAEASAQLVEDTMNVSAEMGVNGQAAAQALQKNLKLAQRYNFKGGVKALGKMSADALRLKLDMDGIAGLADKVFRPEGAIEMAAQLSVMGGEFAKLGDPMQLMFKARNDMEGFARDIGKATAEFVEFNKETGSFEVMGGLARDRMREISKFTGLSVDKLQEMAVQQKKLESIGSVTPVNFEDKDKEFLSSIAKYSEKKKGFTINLGGQEKLISELKSSELESVRNQEQTLKERAEAARSFDETINDLKMSLQQILLPVAQGLKKFVGDPLIKLQDEWRQAGFYDKLKGFAEGAIAIAGGIAKFIIKGAAWLGPGGTLATIIGAGVLFKAASWIFNGRMLRVGFNMGGPMGGPGGGGPGASSPIGGPARGIFGKVGAGNSFGKNLKVAGRSGGAIAGGVLAGITTGAMEWMENDDMGMETGENMGRTAAKGLAAGGGAWAGAAAGAAIGSVVPVVGTLIGGLIGGAIGAFGGSALGESIGDGIYGAESSTTSMNSTNSSFDRDAYLAGDAVKRPIKYLKKDRTLKLPDGSEVTGTNVNGNSKLANELRKDKGGSSNSLTIGGTSTVIVKIEAPNLTEDQVNQLIDTPSIREKFTTSIIETQAKSMTGGIPSGAGATN